MCFQTNTGYLLYVSNQLFQFIVMGSSTSTMLELAKYARTELYLPTERLENLCRSDRYGIWKVGPLLVVAVSEAYY